MEKVKHSFWLGTGIGAVLIILIDLLVPFFGPFLGGFVAGYLAPGDIMNAGRAGLYAGALAGIVVCLVVLARIVSHPLPRYIPTVGSGTLLLLSIFLYLAIIAFLGGAIAGAVRR